MKTASMYGATAGPRMPGIISAALGGDGAHLVPHHLSGRTSVGDGALICSGHHQLADSRRYQIQKVEPGGIRLVRGQWWARRSSSRAPVAGLGLRWWTQPNLFGDFGGEVGMEARPVERAQWTIGVVMPANGLGDGLDPTSHMITFTDTPDVQMSRNSARASMVLSICTRGTAPRDSLIGAVHGTGARLCDTLTPIRDGVTMPWPTLDAYIVGTITPEQAGVIRVTGVDFHYSLGRDHWWRRGVDHVDLEVRQKVSPSLNAHAG